MTEEKNEIVESLDFRIEAGEKELAQQKQRIESVKSMIPALEARVQQLLGAISELRTLRGFAASKKWPASDEAKTPEPPKAETEAPKGA